MCSLLTSQSVERDRRDVAFTLIELLVVMAIIVTIMALIVPAVTGIRGGNELSKATYDISGLLDQARAYGMANKTYVFVGFAEVDASVSASTIPQVSTGSTPYGRVAVAVVASRDGTKHYADATSGQGSDWQTNYAASGKPEFNGNHLVALNKLQRFDNVHLANSQKLNPADSSTIPTSGPMVRPAVSTSNNESYIIGDPNCKSTTPFSWPLGSSLSGGQYQFNKVVQFDPQGVARITYQDNQDTIVQWMEVGLQPTHGSVVSTGANSAAIQVDAMAGSTRIYRP